MTTSEPEGTPSPSRPTPRRRTAAPGPDALPVERLAGPEPGPGPGPGSDSPAPSAPATPPDIEEDGAWVEADAVEIRQAAVGRVDAVDVVVIQGAIGAAHGERVSVEMGALGAAMGSDVTVSQGVSGTILAQRATVEQAFVRTMIAQNVEVRRPSAILFLIAQRVSGDVRVLLDWRGALALGAAFGILAGLFGRGRRGK
jgi:hypothetical protein